MGTKQKTTRPRQRPHHTAAETEKYPAPPEKIGRRKIGGSLVALSAAAVVSVYTLGFVRTRSSLDQLAAAANAPAPTATLTSSTRPVSASVQATSTSQRATATPEKGSGSPAPASSSSAQPAYRDGAYTGVGNSRHGAIAVSVVISGARIVSVSVTQCGTRYSCAYVQPLARLLVDRQSVPVEHVSGATDSSSAFKGAVSQALQKALSGA